MVSLSSYQPSQYSEILHVDPATGSYRVQRLPLANEFFREQGLSAFTLASEQRDLNQAVQQQLIDCFLDTACAERWLQAAQAGLCLRSYVSHRVLAACRRLAARFAGYLGHRPLRYQELLPYVLDDDGKRLILVIDQQQRLLQATGKLDNLAYIRFSVEVLRRFDPTAQAVPNLDVWIYYQTQQHAEIRRLLSEYGLSLFTDWALLNRVSPGQLAQLSDYEQLIVQAFHAVYRRDRRLLTRSETRQRCTEPSQAQLAEMLTRLAPAMAESLTPTALLQALRRIAAQLRCQEVWRKRGAPLAESIEARQEASCWEIADSDSSTIAALEAQETDQVCQQLLQQALTDSIEESLRESLRALQQRRRYAKLADCLIPALRLLYEDGRSQGEIAQALALSNQSQVSRLLNLKQLLAQVRFKTLAKLMQLLAQSSLGVPVDRLDDAHLDQLTQRLEQFLDAEVFAPAIAELKGTKRGESLYAEQLRHCLQHYAHPAKTAHPAIARGDQSRC
ncbi:MAG: hypothetical protein F6J97_07000 [Leptolyngbya sp. SIO4C1]|nr:hypothetical protein [Leptolyngbya sp. SIO4C1]